MKITGSAPTECKAIEGIEREALTGFISDVRNSTYASQPGFPVWAENSWRLDTFAKHSSSISRPAIVDFTTATNGQPLTPDWIEFSKAVIVLKLRNANKSGGLAVSTIRGYSQRLRNFAEHAERNGAEDITQVTQRIAQSFITAHNGATNSKSLITEISNFLKPYGISTIFIVARLKFGRANQRISPSSVKPVSWDNIVALAAAYQMLEPSHSDLSAKRTDFDFMRVYTMMANLLAVSPSRSAELWRLPAHCRVIAEPANSLNFKVDGNENLDFKFGLVWHPVKGGKPLIKPIPTAMQKVANRCIEILESYSDSPRKTAKFIIDNPGVLPIPESLKDIEQCRKTGVIHLSQLKRLMGYYGESWNSFRPWRMFQRTRKTRKKTGNDKTVQTTTFCFETFEIEWWELFKENFRKSFKNDWPYVVNDPSCKLRADDFLLLHYDNQFFPQASYRSKLFFQSTNVNTMGALLKTSKNALIVSLWERLGIKLSDGSAPSLATHQLRHFLNTMAQRAGVPEPIIALWSGRASISQNLTYDHRTDAEKARQHGYHITDYDEMQVDDLLARQVDQAFTGTIALPSIEVLSERDEGIKELARRRLVSISPIGFCLGNLRDEPCPHAVNCLNCARLVVCKGAEKAKVLIVTEN